MTKPSTKRITKRITKPSATSIANVIAALQSVFGENEVTDACYNCTFDANGEIDSETITYTDECGISRTITSNTEDNS